jgi:hypothetical protein
MKTSEVVGYINWADDFALICRKDNRLVTLSDRGEHGVYEMIMLVAECLVQECDHFDEILLAMHEAAGATVH